MQAILQPTQGPSRWQQTRSVPLGYTRDGNNPGNVLAQPQFVQQTGVMPGQSPVIHGFVPTTPLSWASAVSQANSQTPSRKRRLPGG